MSRILAALIIFLTTQCTSVSLSVVQSSTTTDVQPSATDAGMTPTPTPTPTPDGPTPDGPTPDGPTPDGPTPTPTPDGGDGTTGSASGM